MTILIRLSAGIIGAMCLMAVYGRISTTSSNEHHRRHLAVSRLWLEQLYKFTTRAGEAAGERREVQRQPEACELSSLARERSRGTICILHAVRSLHHCDRGTDSNNGLLSPTIAAESSVRRRWNPSTGAPFDPTSLTFSQRIDVGALLFMARDIARQSLRWLAN